MDRRENGENMETMQGEQNVQNEERVQERPMRREQAAGGVESISQTLRVIDTVEHMIGDAYRVPLKKNKCVVDSSEMIDLLGQLRIALPKAVRQAQEVLRSREQIISTAAAQADKTADEADRIYNETVNKAKQFKEEVEAEAEAFDRDLRARAQSDAEAIIADAQTRAEQIIFAAQQQAQTLVDENEITRRAQAYAMETRDRAEQDAENIYNQACLHADKMLSGATAALSRSAGELAQFRDSLLGAPQENA